VAWQYKWVAGPVCLLITLALYLASNHFQVFRPRELYFSPLDRAIPFIPISFWLYASGLLFFPTVYFLNRCTVSLNKHLYSFLALILVSVLVFQLLPTTYPRGLYPLPMDTDPATRFLIHWFWEVDRPTNCAPSLHVSISFLIAFGFIDDQKPYFPWILAWAILLSISTLTTKQHYVVDVLSGFALAVFLFWFFHRHLTYRFPRKLRRGARR
jgi:membrane-associated phospholipid phosphatase